ncbi:restriction endonuclease subunit S [Hippea maritima]|uniref:Type I restriction modification DNA specificity domain-containing protein n=1 Tax=Hippea maritima (strain ATCC 700847 / DSM 10411 / MH2) TaxID=760142 RepID=F2LVL6_HIPMA|nr:restriction endonuclease subunit S [Hippea maritima]AEA33800.1 hypothetical protein Hipma_0830 [Hippea maritima DSM 10411]
MTSYVVVPKTLNISEIENKGFALSPSLFRRVEIKNQNVKTVSGLLTQEPIAGKEVGSNSYIDIETGYKFIRTKAFTPYSFLPDLSINGSFEYLRPKDFENAKGKNSQRIIKEGDILFVTGGNVGEVVIADEILDNSIPSSHILKLFFDNKIKYYILAFLKNEFCKIQSNFGPIGAIGGLDTFDKDTLLSISIPFPNQKNSDEVIEYVELLTKAIINKEKEIRRKHKLILEKIEKELLENQKPNKFEYKLPDILEIEKVGRLDTKLYKRNFKYYEFLIQNYKGGFFYLEESDLRGGSTPKQNERIFGKGEFTWVTPTFISKYGYLDNIEKIAIKSKKNNIKRNCLILINRGNKEDLIRGFYYDYKDLGEGHHNQGCYRIENGNYNLIFLTALLNSQFYRNFVSNLSVGSKMPEIKISQIINIPFPNFPESKQKEIAELYYNPVDYPTDLNLNNFLEEDSKWNEKAGILQLDLSAKKLKERLNEVIYQIVMDEEISIHFNFTL